MKQEVGEVFSARKRSKTELRELLSKLEDWAHRQADAGRKEVTAVVALLRGSLLESEGEAASTLMEVDFLRFDGLASAAPRLREEMAGRARKEAARRQEEIERRLVSVEQRLAMAAQITHECRDEVRGLLEAFARNRELGAERPWQKPKSTAS